MPKQYNNGFVIVTNNFLKSETFRKLSASAFKCYVALRTFSDGYFKDVYPSQETISECSGLSIATVKRSLLELVDLGLVEKIEKNKRSISYRFIGELAQIDTGKESLTAQIDTNIAQNEPTLAQIDTQTSSNLATNNNSYQEFKQQQTKKNSCLLESKDSLIEEPPQPGDFEEPDKTSKITKATLEKWYGKRKLPIKAILEMQNLGLNVRVAHENIKEILAKDSGLIPIILMEFLYQKESGGNFENPGGWLKHKLNGAAKLGSDGLADFLKSDCNHGLKYYNRLLSKRTPTIDDLEERWAKEPPAKIIPRPSAEEYEKKIFGDSASTPKLKRNLETEFKDKIYKPDPNFDYEKDTKELSNV